MKINAETRKKQKREIKYAIFMLNSSAYQHRFIIMLLHRLIIFFIFLVSCFVINFNMLMIMLMLHWFIFHRNCFFFSIFYSYRRLKPYQRNHILSHIIQWFFTDFLIWTIFSVSWAEKFSHILLACEAKYKNLNAVYFLFSLLLQTLQNCSKKFEQKKENRMLSY